MMLLRKILKNDALQKLETHLVPIQLESEKKADSSAEPRVTSQMIHGFLNQ